MADPDERMIGTADFSVTVWGPNSGGGYGVYVKDGVVWHHHYGDAAGGSDDDWRRQDPAAYALGHAEQPRHRDVVIWLRARGLCP